MFLLCLISANLFSQSKKKISGPAAQKIIGEYRYVDKQKTYAKTIIFMAHNVFEYRFLSHMIKDHFIGKWTAVRDTLYVSLIYKKKELPILVKEANDTSTSPDIKIEWVLDSTGAVMKDAKIVVNKDTSTNCMPVFEGDCKFRVGSIESLKVRLMNGIESEWVPLTDKQTKQISITVLLANYLAYYSIPDETKYVFDGRNIISVYKGHKKRYVPLSKE